MNASRKDKNITKDKKSTTSGQPEESVPVVETPAEENSVEPDSTKDSDSQPDKLSDQEQLKDRMLRLQADFDNYRKRMIRERQEFAALANADLLADLLTPLDHMDRAIETMVQSAGEEDACVEGIRLVRSELLSTLERFGLKVMKAVGEEFDPTIHEALGWAPVEDVEDGRIALEVRAGYTLNGRVLRAAQVMLAGDANEALEAAAPAESDAATEE